MEDKFLSSDSDKSLSEDGMNLSLTVVSQTMSSDMHRISSRGVEYSNGENSPSPDADVSSNCGTEDSADSCGQSDGHVSSMTVRSSKRSSIDCQPLRDSSSETIPMIGIQETMIYEKEGQLPHPLTNDTLEQAMAELPTGARLAARTCVDCWRAKKFPTRELISFLRSIAEHSSVLSAALGSPRVPPASSSSSNSLHYEARPSKPSHPAPTPLDPPAVRHREEPSPALRSMAPSRGPMELETPNEELHGEKRKRNVTRHEPPPQQPPQPPLRQQHLSVFQGAHIKKEGLDVRVMLGRPEGTGCSGVAGISVPCGGVAAGSGGKGKHSQAYDQARIAQELRERNSGFNAADRLRKIIPKLCRMLPPKEHLGMVKNIRDYLCLKSTPEKFAEQMKQLVDEHQIVVRNDEADIPKGPRCIWLPPTTPDGRARRATTTLVQSSGWEMPRPPAPLAHGLYHPSTGLPPHLARKRSKTLLDPCVPIPAMPVPSPTVLGGGGAGSVWTGRLVGSPLMQAGCPLCAGSPEPLLDSRWVQCDSCGRYFHAVCARHVSPPPGVSGFKAAFFCPRGDCRQLAAMQGAPPGPSVWDLADTPLGSFLTGKAKAASRHGQHVAVKVLADIFRSPAPPLSNSFPFRSKAVFAFQRLLSGGEVTLFGMYVHEYGFECLPPNAGRAYVQCIDSTPLYGPEQGDERQEILTAIVSGYFEYAREMGFKHVHLHVPPPTDEAAFIFTSRSVNVRIRACMHLAHWYRRVLETAVQRGSIYSFQASSGITSLNFPPSLLETSEAAAEASFRGCTAGAAAAAGLAAGLACPQSAELMQHIAALTERFFVVNLLPPGAAATSAAPDYSPLLPSVYTSTRHDFVVLCHKESLHFHSLAHAQFSAAVLAARVTAEQRHIQLLDSAPKPRVPQHGPRPPPEDSDPPCPRASAPAARPAHWIAGFAQTPQPASLAAAARRPEAQLRSCRNGGWPAQVPAPILAPVPTAIAAIGGFEGASGAMGFDEAARDDARPFGAGAFDGDGDSGDGGEVEPDDGPGGGGGGGDGGGGGEEDEELGNSPPYYEEGLGRPFDRLGGPDGGDSDEDRGYSLAPGPAAGPGFARASGPLVAGAFVREEVMRGSGIGMGGGGGGVGQRGGKDVVDWFSVLVNNEEAGGGNGGGVGGGGGFQSGGPSKSVSPSWQSFPGPAAPYET